MKTNLNIILHLFCCEMFPVKTLSSVWCDLKVKMKRQKKKNLISKPTSHHKISTIQPNHPADRHNPSQPPTKSVPVQLATTRSAQNLAPTTRSAQPQGIHGPSNQINIFNYQIGASQPPSTPLATIGAYQPQIEALPPLFTKTQPP